MRILFWTELFPPLIGGAAILNAKLVQSLSARGHDLAVIASLQGQDLPEEDEFEGVPLYRLPLWTTLNGRDLEAFLRLRQRILRLKESFAPDLVHLSFTGASGLLHLQTAKTPTPTVAAVHVDPAPDRSNGELAARVLGSADWVTATTQWILGAVRSLVPEVLERSSCVYNGISVPEVRPTPIPEGPPRLLVLGRVAAEKGVGVAIRAATRLAERYPGLRLTVIGDGPAMPELAALAAELGAEETVLFKGWVEPQRVWNEISDHTLVLVPSVWEEAFGMVAVEAALMERPVIASRMGGLPEVVADGETGLLVRPNDPEDLADAIAGLLDNPVALRVMGKAGRHRVTRTFGWERYVDEYEALYRTVLAGHEAAGSTWKVTA